MLNLIIFGPPGSGKGTQSARITRKYCLTHISTGDLLREEMARGTELGREIAGFIDQGNLVPDDIVIKELRQTLEQHSLEAGFIFDGFPRTLVQAEMLDEMLLTCAMSVDLVLSIDVSEQELLNRLMGRSEDSGRSDDCEEVIWKRIEVYKSQSFPLIDYYADMGKLVRINGMDPVDKVFGKISRAIDTYVNSREVIPEIL